MGSAGRVGPPTGGQLGPRTIGATSAPPISKQPPHQGTGGPGQPVSTPLVDIVEATDEVLIIADVPGFDEEEITLRADDNTLLVAAQRTDDIDGNEEYRTVQSERPRRFERVLQLPPNSNIDEATATYDDGVCTVTIPEDDTIRRHIGFQ